MSRPPRLIQNRIFGHSSTVVFLVRKAQYGNVDIRHPFCLASGRQLNVGRLSQQTDGLARQGRLVSATMHCRCTHFCMPSHHQQFYHQPASKHDPSRPAALACRKVCSMHEAGNGAGFARRPLPPLCSSAECMHGPPILSYYGVATPN